MEDWPCALVGADDKDKELLKFLEKHQIDYGYKCNEKIPSFAHNGISWYCHEKSAKKVHKKFNITEIHTDKEQLKQQKVKEDELKKQMKTEEWLLNKLQLDGSKIFGRHKRLKFAQELKEMKHIDNLTYKTFVKKFNETYSNTLRTEQRDLLTNYIVSFSDNGLGLKAFLNEEISRLKKEVYECTKRPKINENKAFLAKTERVLKQLDGYAKSPITESIVREIFYIQDLVAEVNRNGS